MTVTAVVDLLPRLRRITLTAEEFRAFIRAGADECFGLLVPADGRPHLRWYTVREHRPGLAEIDVDVVLHDHGGPAVRWALAARPGTRIDFRRSGASYAPPPDCGTQLLLADETALPALAAIVESLPPGTAGVRAVVELPNTSWTYDVGGDVEIEWRPRDGTAPGTRLLEAVVEPGRVGYAWVCGEAAGVKAVRRDLIRGWGLDRRLITFSGYWRVGREGGYDQG